MVPAKSDHRQRALDRFKTLFKFLDANYQDLISPADAAKTVHMSPSHFRRAFKQLTGQSFVLYLNHFRIAKAQELLRSTNKSIADVGIEVGFCDQSYFGLTFRRHTQMTPMQYRNKVQQTPWDEKSDNYPGPTPKAKSISIRIT